MFFSSVRIQCLMVLHLLGEQDLHLWKPELPVTLAVWDCNVCVCVCAHARVHMYVCVCVCACVSCSVVFKSFAIPWTVTHQAPLSWNSPGNNTGVGSCSLLQSIFRIHESNPGLLHCRQILYHLSHQGSSFPLTLSRSIIGAWENPLGSRYILLVPTV